MNKNRRKRIEELAGQIETLIEEVGTVHAEEQDYVENFPENMQSSERYDTAETATAELEEAIGSLDCALENLNNARGDC